jgi:hypothetical protein
MNLLIILGFLTFVAVAGVATGNEAVARSVHERQMKTSTTWERMPSSVDLTTSLPLHIALAQQNLETSEEDLM